MIDRKKIEAELNKLFDEHPALLKEMENSKDLFEVANISRNLAKMSGKITAFKSILNGDFDKKSTELTEKTKEAKEALEHFIEKDKSVCSKCNHDIFEVYEIYGAEGSGIYLVFICTHCGEFTSLELENPNYEG